MFINYDNNDDENSIYQSTNNNKKDYIIIFIILVEGDASDTREGMTCKAQSCDNNSDRNME